ncbi:MAG TPA: GrdX family protein [Synergistales bacterium]|nr:GrdX family protein [Synergistales bacterium]HRS48264.1 GrdX family protein [Thermovirgaceae bacterium]
MKDLLIVTNNPLVVERYADCLKAEGSPVEVVEEASRMLLEGYCLFGSPLPPNGRLMKNPFRSIALMREKKQVKEGRDFLLLEKARQRLTVTPFLSGEGKRGEDLAFMDLALLEASLDRR